jgi:tRNA pseudouridine13 synthase
MKLKSTPEDFKVEEQTSIQPSNGPYALYRLSKRGFGTPEAIAEILRRWDIPRQRISYGGLKDRHATTLQYVTIARGPHANLEDRSYLLEYLGQTPQPFGAKDIDSNRFEIRLRSIPTSRRAELDKRLEQAREFGVMNYFDDQRFGSIGESGELIGLHWCKTNYERALYLALAEHNMHDRPREREQKNILRDYWGQWEKCKAMLDRSHRRSVVTFLVDHPTNFKRAVALIRIDLRSIYIAAFQSWIWNRWVSALVDRFNGDIPKRSLPSLSGPLSLPQWPNRESADQWRQIAEIPIPLPSARQHHWPDGTLELLESVLQPLQITPRELRLKFPRDTFFSRGDRSMVLKPMHMAGGWESDPNAPELSHWLLQFELPRGAYATMIVRQLMDDAAELAWEEEDEQPKSDDEPDAEPYEQPHDTTDSSPREEAV